MKQLEDIALEAITTNPEKGWMLRTKIYAFFNGVKFDTSNEKQMYKVLEVFAKYALEHNMSYDEAAYYTWGTKPASFFK